MSKILHNEAFTQEIDEVSVLVYADWLDENVDSFQANLCRKMFGEIWLDGQEQLKIITNQIKNCNNFHNNDNIYENINSNIIYLKLNSQEETREPDPEISNLLYGYKTWSHKIDYIKIDNPQSLRTIKIKIVAWHEQRFIENANYSTKYITDWDQLNEETT
jgi:hypothetical protein